MACRLPFALLSAASAAAYPLPPLTGYGIVEPAGFSVLRTSGQSALYEVLLPQGSSFASGPVLLANLTGDREELGRAYAELLGDEAIDSWDLLMKNFLGDRPIAKALIVRFLDWLWSRRYQFHVPEGYLAELRGMHKASPKNRGITVDQVSARFNALANMPAMVPDIVAALEFELARGLPRWERELLGKVLDHFTHCTWCRRDDEGSLRVPFSPGCDSFGVWGPRTESGELFVSRNLDWYQDLGAAKHKLVLVSHVPGTHATVAFGFASGFGMLAGMNERGVTVGEMNLDNSKAGFSGPPFPLRLRMVLETADDLASAKALWQATANTDSMNFMIGSAKDGKSMAIEAMRGHSAFYLDNDPVEAAATCKDIQSTGPGSCGTAYPEVRAKEGLKRIGFPLPSAVWRSNHAMDPEHRRSQAPMSNDTAFRYSLIHDLILEHERRRKLIGHAEAVSIAAALGVKGPNFLSCDPAQFKGIKAANGANTFSAVYQPVVGAGAAYLAWEDGSKDSWRPAACSTYVKFELEKWWGSSKTAAAEEMILV